MPQFKTIEDARAYRYGSWTAGGVRGNAYKEGFCAEEVWLGDRASSHYQCSKKAQEGKLYCKIHDPEAKAAKRKAESDRRDTEYSALRAARAKAERIAAAEKAVLEHAIASATVGIVTQGLVEAVESLKEARNASDQAN